MPKKRTNEDVMRMLQGHLWESHFYWAYFSKHPAGVEGVYFWFLGNKETGIRTHYTYGLYGQNLIVDCHNPYSVKILDGYSRYCMLMIQLVDVYDFMNYTTWNAEPLPTERKKYDLVK